MSNIGPGVTCKTRPPHLAGRVKIKDGEACGQARSLAQEQFLRDTAAPQTRAGQLPSRTLWESEEPPASWHRAPASSSETAGSGSGPGWVGEGPVRTVWATVTCFGFFSTLSLLTSDLWFLCFRQHRWQQCDCHPRAWRADH